MITTPSTHGSSGNGDGRDPKGRFAPGNKLGRGNPLAGRAAKIRAVLMRKLTDKVVDELADVVLGMARGGDLAAFRELLDRTQGKSVAFDVLQRVQELEERLDALIEENHERQAGPY